MGGKESSQEDSQYYANVSFKMNLLVCGNYDKNSIEKELEKFSSVRDYEGKKYIEVATHKTIPEWKFYFFDKNKDIGENTIDFIRDSIIRKIDYNNLILFYTGLENFTYENLLKFYDGQETTNYHPIILIIKEKNENINLPEMKKFNKNFIRIYDKNDKLGILINIIEIASYYNQLGDEIGYPKRFTEQSLLDKDNYLITKYLFTFNILLCGKPGVGKSTLINILLGKEKSYAKTGSNSITNKIIKYIHEKYPIVLYDSPGFETEDNIVSVQKLISEKNKSLNEEKNKIHCIFYLVNRKNERFLKNEYNFLKNLIQEKIDIFIVATHAESKENSADYIEATKIYIQQNSNGKEEIKNLNDYIYPIELKNENNYKRFGLKELFNDVYKRYEKEKTLFEINQRNIENVKSQFLKDILSKENLKKKLTSLSLRVKSNFKLLAASLGTNADIKGTTMLSNSVIKIISNIYNIKITTKECLNIIEQNGYTNEIKNQDTLIRKVEKGFASIFYFNGPASKEVDYLAEYLIKLYNKKIDNDEYYYRFLNIFRTSINETIESLKNFNDN